MTGDATRPTVIRLELKIDGLRARPRLLFTGRVGVSQLSARTAVAEMAVAGACWARYSGLRQDSTEAVWDGGRAEHPDADQRQRGSVAAGMEHQTEPRVVGEQPQGLHRVAGRQIIGGLAVVPSTGRDASRH